MHPFAGQVQLSGAESSRRHEVFWNFLTITNLAYFDDFHLSLLEHDFIANVRKDIEVFLTKSFAENCTRRVLLFPPLDSRHRFLIHRVVEDVNPDINLKTLSIGNDAKRRTVVHFTRSAQEELTPKNKMLDVENPTSKTQKYDGNDTSKFKHQNSNAQTNRGGHARNTPTARARNRRPDKQLYVPRGRRDEDGSVPKAAVTTTSEIVETANVPSRSSKIKNAKSNRNSANDRRAPQQAPKTPSEKRDTAPCPSGASHPPAPSTPSIDNLVAPDDDSGSSPSLAAGYSISHCEEVIGELVSTSPPPPPEHPLVTEDFTDEINNCCVAFSDKQLPSLNEIERTSCDFGNDSSSSSRSATNEPKAVHGCYENGSEQETSEEVFVDAADDDTWREVDVGGDVSVSRGKCRTSIGWTSESTSEMEEDADGCRDEVATEVCSCNGGDGGGCDDSTSEGVAAAPAVVQLSTCDGEHGTTPSGGNGSHTAVSREDPCEDDDEDTWDAIYDENGDCLDPELELQISKTFGQVSIEVPHLDYLAFKPKKLDLSDEEYGHVIEIYDFPAEFKTQDLLAAFLRFQEKGFDIKWVDDTHALGVFASQIAASDALSINHPFIKTRPLSQATPESRKKAQRRSEFLQPYKQRPQTSAALARRMVSSALGLSMPVSRETREEERKKLIEAKERRKLAAKQKEAAWEGQIASAE